MIAHLTRCVLHRKGAVIVLHVGTRILRMRYAMVVRTGSGWVSVGCVCARVCVRAYVCVRARACECVGVRARACECVGVRARACRHACVYASCVHVRACPCM